MWENYFGGKEQHKELNMEMNPSVHCTMSDPKLPCIAWKDDQVKTKHFRGRMATATQPTVLDRLKERLVVALGKSQDKRVKSMYTSNIKVNFQKNFVSGV